MVRLRRRGWGGIGRGTSNGQDGARISMALGLKVWLINERDVIDHEYTLDRTIVSE
jgi:hypothetical protein